MNGVLGMRTLKKLDVRDNEISSIDHCIDVLSDLESLKELAMNGNPVCNDPGYKPKIMLATSDKPLDRLDLRILASEEYDELNVQPFFSADGDFHTEVAVATKIHDVYDNRMRTLKEIKMRNTENSIVNQILQESENDLHEKLAALSEYVKTVSS